MSDRQRLVLFDFDGTLTRYDSLIVFLRFFKGDYYFFRKLLLSIPGLLIYKLGFVENSKAKEILLANFLKGTTVEYFLSRCLVFAQVKIPLILRQPVFNSFLDHISKGDKVIIVSASLVDWISPWSRQWDVEVLATRLATVKGVLTGKYEGLNCNGEEKVSRLKEYLILSDYDEIWAYGDSKGDEPMLNLASRVVYQGEIRK